MILRRLLVVGGALAISACAPSAQTLHHDRIQDRLTESRADRSVHAGEAVLRPSDGRALSRRALVRAVLARNPDLEAARHGWQAALARHQQNDSLPDPVLGYSLAPGSIFDPDVRFGQIIQLSQTFPWPGKIGGRGDAALFRAEMEAEDYQTARLELALQSCRLHDRHYAVARALELLDAERRVVEALRKAVTAQYAAGNGQLNDPLQAEVMLAHIEHDEEVLRAERKVVVAQLNALLHRAPDAELRPPPKRLPAIGMVADREAPALADRAVSARPELRALDAERHSRQASVDVAQREYLPDFTVSGSYNSMWPMVSHQFMVGVSASVPIMLDRREGGERAARAQVLESESRREAMEDRVRSEVHQAVAKLAEAHHVVMLYRDRLLPLADKQARAVRSAFATANASFFEVLVAERNRHELARSLHQALAGLHTRRAELDRALGRVPGLGGHGGEP